jgi:hypothetical protein
MSDQSDLLAALGRIESVMTDIRDDLRQARAPKVIVAQTALNFTAEQRAALLGLLDGIREGVGQRRSVRLRDEPPAGDRVEPDRPPGTSP